MSVCVTNPPDSVTGSVPVGSSGSASEIMSIYYNLLLVQINFVGIPKPVDSAGFGNTLGVVVDRCRWQLS